MHEDLASTIKYVGVQGRKPELLAPTSCQRSEMATDGCPVVGHLVEPCWASCHRLMDPGLRLIDLKIPAQVVSKACADHWF